MQTDGGLSGFSDKAKLPNTVFPKLCGEDLRMVIPVHKRHEQYDRQIEIRPQLRGLEVDGKTLADHVSRAILDVGIVQGR